MVRTLIDTVRNNKRIAVALGVIVASLILLLLLPSDSPEASRAECATLEEYKEWLEGELEVLCSSVDGVGRCSVFVTFERGAESTYKGGVLTDSRPPRVLGISVVCRGAESQRVQRELTELLCSLFDVGSNRVKILKMK